MTKETYPELGLWLEEKLGGRLRGRACYDLADSFVEETKKVIQVPLLNRIMELEAQVEQCQTSVTNVKSSLSTVEAETLKFERERLADWLLGEVPYKESHQETSIPRYLELSRESLSHYRATGELKLFPWKD